MYKNCNAEKQRRREDPPESEDESRRGAESEDPANGGIFYVRKRPSDAAPDISRRKQPRGGTDEEAPGAKYRIESGWFSPGAFEVYWANFG